MKNLVWYNSLNKSNLTPPSEIFMPVWEFLYFTIFVSLMIFSLTKTNKSKLKGYIYFFSQILLNILWPYVFFTQHNLLKSLIIIILIGFFLILTIKEFYKISKTSAYILIPYFIWIIFATYLNLKIVLLN